MSIKNDTPKDVTGRNLHRMHQFAYNYTPGLIDRRASLGSHADRVTFSPIFRDFYQVSGLIKKNKEIVTRRQIEHSPGYRSSM